MKIRELFTNVQTDGAEVSVNGWVRTLRVSKNFGFIELNDGSYFKNLQVVIEADKLDNFAELSKQNVGAALRVKGILALTPDAKQPFEVKAESVEIEGVSAPEYPLQKNVIQWNFCVQFRICAPEQIHFRQFSAYVRWSHMQYTSSLTSAALYMCILR